ILSQSPDGPANPRGTPEMPPGYPRDIPAISQRCSVLLTLHHFHGAVGLQDYFLRDAAQPEAGHVAVTAGGPDDHTCRPDFGCFQDILAGIAFNYCSADAILREFLSKLGGEFVKKTLSAFL